MNQRTEDLLRDHLRSVDSAKLSPTSTVGDRVAHSERRLALRRRNLAAGSMLVTVALVGGLVWNTSASPQTITGEDGLPSTTATRSTVVAPTVAVDDGLWAAIPAGTKPVSGANVVWTGTEALMIGGTYLDGTPSGIHAYNPTTSTWRLAFHDVVVDGENPLAFWAETRLVLIGSGVPNVVGFDLSDGIVWRSQTVEATGIDATAPWVWTGSELLVWPTAYPNGDVPPDGLPRAFDYGAGEWRALAQPPIVARSNAASVWTGSEWIVWGGSRGEKYFADGAAYNPATDSWRLLAASPLSARQAPAVWTGSEVLITGGVDPNALADGAAYDPITDTWRSTAPGFGHPGFTPVWTGELLLLFAKGGAVWYDPTGDQWTTGDFTWGDVPHLDDSPVWTGEVVLLLGSHDGSTGGAIFTPPPT